MHVTGLLIHAELERAAGIEAHLAGLPGVEVHAIGGSVLRNESRCDSRSARRLRF